MAQGRGLLSRTDVLRAYLLQLLAVFALVGFGLGVAGAIGVFRESTRQRVLDVVIAGVSALVLYLARAGLERTRERQRGA